MTLGPLRPWREEPAPRASPGRGTGAQPVRERMGPPGGGIEEKPSAHGAGGFFYVRGLGSHMLVRSVLPSGRARIFRLCAEGTKSAEFMADTLVPSVAVPNAARR